MKLHGEISCRGVVPRLLGRSPEETFAKLKVSLWTTRRALVGQGFERRYVDTILSRHHAGDWPTAPVDLGVTRIRRASMYAACLIRPLLYQHQDQDRVLGNKPHHQKGEIAIAKEPEDEERQDHE